MSNLDFIGRDKEQFLLNKCYQEKRSHFSVLYGRRRIGKTELLKHYCSDKTSFYYSALDGTQEEQIKNFLKDFSAFAGDPLIALLSLTAWREVFDVVVSKLPKGKIVIVLDEFQWMCRPGSSLQSVIQHVWDHHWQYHNTVHLILCGSSTSFMISEVLAEKSPLFGRRTQTLELMALTSSEARQLLGIKKNGDAIRYLMCFGAVPAYLKLYHRHQSFEQNINHLSFVENAYFVDELKYILSSQLKQPKKYFKILQHLARRSMTLTDLSRALKTPTGSLMFNVDRLKEIGIIHEHRPITLSETSKTVLYKITDEYVRFYFLFIHPNRQAIEHNSKKFIFDTLVKPQWHSYLGLAFEVFCHKNLQVILKKLNLEDVFVRSGMYWHKSSVRHGPGVQIDLVIECRDRTTLIGECKWSETQIGYELMKELETKCQRYPNPKKHTLRKLLVTNARLSPNLVDHPELDVVGLDDFFN